MTDSTWPRNQYTGPDGGAYTGPDGGMYSGPSSNPYRSNIPPWAVLIEYLEQNGMEDIAEIIRSLKEKQMHKKSLIFIITIAFSLNTYSKDIVKSTKKFDGWKVTISEDDFDKEIKPKVASYIYSLDGKHIGWLNIGYFSKSEKQFSNAFFNIRMTGLDGTWPACAYEYTKYSIDNSKPEYFPSSGRACPTLNFGNLMATKFKRGNEFKFSASGVTGVVKLKGFTKAWNHALGAFVGLQSKSKVDCNKAQNILKQAVILSNRLNIKSCIKTNKNHTTILKGIYSTPLTNRTGNHIPYEIFYQGGVLVKVRFFNDPSDEVQASEMPVH